MVGVTRFMWKVNSCYRYDAQSESREALTGAGGGVQGVLGASEDGEDVYVAARWASGAGRLRNESGEEKWADRSKNLVR